MQSAFIIRNMDLTPEPPSPNMAAAAKRRFRKCTHCTSRMPSIRYDNHTLCTKCRKQECDMTLVCAECRDWPITKRQVFVDYSNSLRVKRESKQHQARLAAAYASDQYVYERGTSPTRRVSKLYKRHSLPHSGRLLHLAIKASVHINPFWTLPNRLPRT